MENSIQDRRSRRVMKLVSDFWLAAAVVLLTIIVGGLRPDLLDPSNVASVLKSVSIMVVMVLGLTWVISAGKIDVSFMQVAALANMSCAFALSHGWSWGPGALLGIGIGIIVGLFNGWLVSVVRLPSLIVTIATAGICASIAAALGQGMVIRINNPGPLAKLLQPEFGLLCPVIVLPVLAVSAVALFFQERLTFGRYIYAMGQNETAARSVGVPVVKLSILLFVLSGGSAACAGVLLASDLSSGQPMIGGPFLINGLTVVFLGSMMVRMGKPNILGTLTAALFLGVFFSSATLLGLPNYQRQIIQGVLLLIGLIVATTASGNYRKYKGRH